ncbi:MAG: bifunctional 4-hydroxy-2-oxoglutarate aldolase/2-dehydro-3-deoxy-phosphogluconate aldolase [Candidatus Bathyarchaeota archaeon]|nr:MAG: bifunctional 4-hydroxy-2-oxoglutarate aldolase/2-dehydro-3-deoxy-phosphogluconate aldolase [Candidatus Bathyarchaeota archaeon]
MPKLERRRVIDEILGTGLIPVFHSGVSEVARSVVEACHGGGARVVEFTNRGDRAYDVFSALSEWCAGELPDVVLGAGTIIDLGTAASYINAGAAFVVGPSFNRGVAGLCNRRRVLYIPGCQTPTEITEAEEMGAAIIKLFPASTLGPRFVKSILGPMPHTQLMPSGGVKANRDDITAWIGAGAVALNIGSDLIRRDLVEGGMYGEIKEKVERCIVWISEAKSAGGQTG